MARGPAKHVAEAHRRAQEHIGKMTRDAIDQSRASRSPAHRLYGREGPRGGPERTSQRGEPKDKTLTPAEAKAVERAAGPLGSAVMSALRSAGLIAGARSAPARSPNQDRGAMSPLGGAAT
jgi:hypothetical protein